MKLKGIFGKGSGKLGSSVFVVSGGEQIVREHNPRVSNPNTEAQVTQRAKFKLLTQLAATLAPVIVIPKKGMTSARNQFVRKNISFAEFIEDTAQVAYEKLQITNGIATMAAVEATLVQGTGINVALETSMEGATDRVVYALLKKTADGKLQFVDSVVVTNAGADGKFAATLPETDSEAVVYAYGMSDNSSSAKMRYDNYNVETGEDIATLIATRTLKASDYTFTATEGCTVPFEPAVDAQISSVKIGTSEQAAQNFDTVTIDGNLASNFDIIGTEMLGNWLCGGETVSDEHDYPTETRVNFDTPPSAGTYDVTFNGVHILTIIVTI